MASQASSMVDTLSHNTSIHHGANSTIGRGGKNNTAPNQEDDNFALETFINSLQLNLFFRLPDEEQDERLSKIDALELFQAVQDVNRELAMSRLENLYLTDFLEKNDPKLLIGLQQRRVTAQNLMSQQMRGTKEQAVSIAGTSTRSKASISKSQMTTTMSTHTAGSTKKVSSEYRLNFKAKADMADKTANDVEKRVREIENSASREIKILRGRMEEMRFMFEETQETAKNFQLHFLRDEYDVEFLNTATEKQVERKVRKFMSNWSKNAKALLATMRLKITALQENCQQLRNELLTKADLSGILTAIDFEKLVIKRAELMQSLEEKNTHMTGLKGVTGRASLAMTEEKQTMMQIEEESKKLTNRTIDVVKTIGKLEKEARIVEKENEKDTEILENLKVQLSRFEAPSVNQYINKKDEVLFLEKEEKMLRRKLAILNMKYTNTLKKCKRKPDDFLHFIH